MKQYKGFDKTMVVDVTYGLMSFRKDFSTTPVSDEDKYCAWCNKSVAEIGKDKIIEHCEEHVKNKDL